MILIDADALINELNNSRYPGAPYIDAGISIAIGKVCDAPTINPEPKWIPCSERLPEDYTDVFVYLFGSPSPYIAWIEDTHWYTGDFEVDREDEPVAWMPLPEPYKGEQK